MHDKLRDYGLLVLRLAFGLSLAYHGYGKIFAYHDLFVAGVAGMGFPAPTLFAWIATMTEFAGGLLLAAGLGTRVAAYFITCNMAVAGFVALAGKPFEERELAFAFLFAALTLAMTGGGRFALERLFCRAQRAD